MNSVTKIKSTLAQTLSRAFIAASSALAYFFLPFAAALAHEREETTTVLSEADWIGPLAALAIISVALAAAKTIKNKR